MHAVFSTSEASSALGFGNIKARCACFIAMATGNTPVTGLNSPVNDNSPITS